MHATEDLELNIIFYSIEINLFYYLELNVHSVIFFMNMLKIITVAMRRTLFKAYIRENVNRVIRFPEN